MIQLINKLDRQKVFLRKNLYNLSGRIELLKKLEQMIILNQNRIYEAYKEEFNRDVSDVFEFEISPVLKEIKYFIRKSNTMFSSKYLFYSLKNLFYWNGKYVYVPYGSIFISISNSFVFASALLSIVGVISTGNSAFVKLPHFSPKINMVIKTLISTVFDDNYVYFVDDILTDEQKNGFQELNFNFVLMMNDVKTPKSEIRCFSNRSIPVVYQLENKSLVVIDETANIKKTAKKVLHAKVFQSGQNSFSPDGVIIHEAVYDQFMREFIREYNLHINYFKRKQSKIISHENYIKLKSLLEKNQQFITFGGKFNDETRTIEISIINITDNLINSDLLFNNIHGPLLPIIKYNNESDIYGIIDNNTTPLSLYTFTKNDNFIKRFRRYTKAKTIIFNDIIPDLFYNYPYDGIRLNGNTSFGKKLSIDLLCQRKTIVRSLPSHLLLKWW